MSPAATPPCLHCGTPRDEWDGPDHVFSPCCSDDCLALAHDSGKHPRLMLGSEPRPLDLEAIHDRALLLCNGVEEVVTMGESLEVMLADDADRAPVYAEAIANAGADQLALLAELKATRAKLHSLQGACRRIYTKGRNRGHSHSWTVEETGDEFLNVIGPMLSSGGAW